MNLEILKAKSIENWRNRTQMHSNKISGPLCLVSFLGSRCMDSVWVRIGYIFSTYSSNLLRWEIFNATQNVLCFSLPHFHMGSNCEFSFTCMDTWTCRMNIRAHTCLSSTLLADFDLWLWRLCSCGIDWYSRSLIKNMTS